MALGYPCEKGCLTPKGAIAARRMRTTGLQLPFYRMFVISKHSWIYNAVVIQIFLDKPPYILLSKGLAKMDATCL